MEGYFREKMSADALDVITRKGGAESLGVVRKVLRDNKIPFSIAQLDFLRRFGEWEDISFIINRVTTHAGPSILSPWAGTEEELRAAAETMVAIGRGRIRDLLRIEMPDHLLGQVILAISDSEFRSLPDGALLELFKSEHADVRKKAALRSVAVVPKSR